MINICIWEIENGVVTFGPATGGTKDCLSVREYSDRNKGEHCIAEDSWSEISSNIKSGHAYYCSDCQFGIILFETLGT